ncbi:MAG TPA: VUT family protein [Chroococcidiopsis sp.]
MIHSIIYILAVLGANYTTTPEWFIPLPIFGQVALGTFIFGVTFTQRDRLHHYGRPWVYGTIAIAAFANLLMSSLLSVPLRIILASFTAIILSETADTEIYQRLLGKSWLVRVAGSNAISVPLDTLLFSVIAFWGVLPLSDIVALLVGETLIKYLVGAVTALYRDKRVTAAGS